MNKKRAVGFYLITVSIILSLSKLTITGAAIGAKPTDVFVFLAVGSFLAGVVLIFTPKSDLEKKIMEEKLGQIEDVKTRRELLSDAHRAEKFAERGYDVNALWDSRKSFEENKRTFYEHFYDDVDNEITDAFWKAYLRKKISNKDFRKNISKYTNTKEFEDFRIKALKAITEFNNKIISEEIFPIYIESEVSSKDYPGMMMRMVHYGHKNLIGKTKNAYKRMRNRGETIVAHEIINPEAIESPEYLRKTPHIHWELDKIGNRNYRDKLREKYNINLT